MPDARKKKKPAAAGRKINTTRRRTEAEDNFRLGLTGFAVLLMLASSLMFLLNIFGVSALLLDGYAGLMKGLLGAGYFVLPFVLLAAVLMLALTPKAKWRGTQFASVLCLPLLVGGWGHLFTAGINGVSYFRKSGFFSIFTDGRALRSGGLLSGAVTDFLSFLISPYGAGVVLFLLTALTAVWLCRLSPVEVLAALVAEFRRFGEDSDRAMDEKKEQYLKNREEKRARRTEERRAEAAARTSPDTVSASAGVDPRAYDLPLDEDRPRPRGIFTFHPVGEQTEESEGGEIAFEPADIFFDPSVKSPAEEEAVTAEDPFIDSSPAEDPFDPSADPDAEASLAVLPPGYEVLAETGEVAETAAASEEAETAGQTDAEEAVTGDMIYEYKEGDGDRMLSENGIDPEAIKVDETQVSSSLRPGDAEKARLAAALAARQKPVYQKPSLDLLTEAVSAPSVASDEEIKTNAKRLIETLASFNIDARITNIIRGPSITRYEVQLKQGIRFSRLTSLSDDIALSLAAQSVRIAAIPDKVAVGIEVPNKHVSTVYIRECLASSEFADNPSRVAFALGKDITGKCIVWDIAKLPHMLVAGTTGSGKSVCVNSLLISLLYKSTPDEVKFIMIDPKIIELGVYNGIPHLLTPVVTDPKKAAGALQWAVYEMMRRYKQMADLGVRSIFEYNAEVERRRSMPEEPGDEDRVKMAQIVIVVDELADLMLSSPREVEEAICRLAQMARAAGMHLIIATQRPSADVITGLMKANIPSRIAFAVSSALDSRIILDAQGAERLVGRGDMLFSPVGSSKPIRIQGCFISSDEIEAVCRHAKRYGAPDYDQAVLEHIEKASEAIGKGKKSASSDFDGDDNDAGGETDTDPLLNDAIDIVMETQMASASNLQRRLKLGYTRAARIIDIMEEKGIVGPFQGSKPRQILMSKDRWMEMKNQRSE